MEQLGEERKEEIQGIREEIYAEVKVNERTRLASLYLLASVRRRAEFRLSAVVNLSFLHHFLCLLRFSTFCSWGCQGTDLSLYRYLFFNSSLNIE